MDRKRWFGLGTGLAFVGAAAWALAAGPEPGRTVDGGVPGAAPAVAPVEAAKPPSDKVKIIFTVVPNTKKATVTWGKKKLGVIAQRQPLVVQRPRDSGPLDVMVRAEGCVPVQTRAYTFADNKVAVKVTPLEQKNTLLGYREELPPDGGVPLAGGPDGGVR